MEIAQPQVSSFGTLGFAVEAAPFFVTESRHAPHARIPMHRHGAPNLAIVIQGGFEETSGPYDRECGEGSLIVHPGDDAHYDRIGCEGAVCLNIFLQDNVLPDHLSAIFSVERNVLNDQLSRRARKLHDKVRAGTAHANVIADESLELVSLLPRDEAARKSPPKWLRCIADLLNEEPNTTANLTTLAESARVHPVHLSRSFFRHYGMTLGEHRRRRQIEWARDRLVDQSVALARVALDAGYCDQAHFTRAFRARFGTTPAEFRRLRAGNRQAACSACP